MKTELTAQRLRELFHYDQASGTFTRRRQAGTAPAGDVAGYLDRSTGYLRISVDDRNYYAHRLAFLYVTGEMPASGVDHKNGCKSDNRWDNIRPATQAENAQNMKLRSDSTSGYPGVSLSKSKRKWVAYIQADGRRRTIGLFSDMHSAVAARSEAKRSLHQFNPTDRVD